MHCNMLKYFMASKNVFRPWCDAVTTFIDQLRTAYPHVDISHVDVIIKTALQADPEKACMVFYNYVHPLKDHIINRDESLLMEKWSDIPLIGEFPIYDEFKKSSEFNKDVIWKHLKRIYTMAARVVEPRLQKSTAPPSAGPAAANMLNNMAQNSRVNQPGTVTFKLNKVIEKVLEQSGIGVNKPFGIEDLKQTDRMFDLAINMLKEARAEDIPIFDPDTLMTIAGEFGIPPALIKMTMSSIIPNANTKNPFGMDTPADTANGPPVDVNALLNQFGPMFKNMG